MFGQKGIFFTFMAFLLVSTLIVLASSVEQAESGEETKLADKAALNEVRSVYGNLERQLLKIEELHMTARTPFTNFQTGNDWILFEGTLPLQDVGLEEGFDEAFDAMNLFKVFAEEKSLEGILVDVGNVPQGGTWGATGWSGGKADVNYLFLNPCLRVSGRSIAENGMERTSIRIEEANDPKCTDAFNCTDITGLDVDVVFGTNFPDSDITGSGCVVTNENMDLGECFKTVELANSGTIINIELGRLIGSAVCPSSDGSFSVYIQFNEALGNFSLENTGREDYETRVTDDFNYSVKKAGFGFCAGTGEDVCVPQCQGSGDCDDSDSCTIDACDVVSGSCEFEAVTECIDSDGCCPAGCASPPDTDCP